MKKMKQYYFGLIAVLLLAVLAVSPVAGGSNDTWDQSYYLTHKETLAGQRDMSRFNPVVTPVPIQTMNATTARLYPGMMACGSSGCIDTKPCPFPFLRCSRPLTVMVAYNVNESRPEVPGPVAGISIVGGPFFEPVNLYRAGTPDVILPFDLHAGSVP
ncbi:MAG: hypothetical protein PHD55_03075 [Methanoregula sp.]|nr:hypothetical protein [Methanoregula sp.]